ncbi:NADH dehydrogenase (ubiquinone) B15 subunit [Lasioglossum baleicum]|uniref:NADH dehydrogenase (ubiquinone) B15 subunit n=1 Tax=Lasioglossum baleicum TaxID=434251 RepID=UPI003FCC378A
MSSNKFETFDVSPESREAIEQRAARRKALRESYLRQVHNPVKQQLIMDEGIYRYSIVRQFHEQFGKVTIRSYILGYGITTGIFVLYTWIGKRIKNREEHLWSTGQVPYADRKYKFNT